MFKLVFGAIVALAPLQIDAAPTATVAENLAPDATIGGAVTTYTSTIFTFVPPGGPFGTEANLPGVYNNLNWTHMNVAQFCDINCIIYPPSFPLDAQLDLSNPAQPPAFSTRFNGSQVSSFAFRSFYGGCQATQPFTTHSPDGTNETQLVSQPAKCIFEARAVLPGLPSTLPPYATMQWTYTPDAHLEYYTGFPQAGMSQFNITNKPAFELLQEMQLTARPFNSSYAKNFEVFIDNVVYVTRNKTHTA